MPQHLKLPDGRTLDYEVTGKEEDFPLIFIHGTPGSCIVDPDLIAACQRKGVKMISFSRPGYGGSTRLKDSRIVDIVKDIQALKEHLGIKKCLVAGWSGGGPPALACAARLPDCIAVLFIAGSAPYNAEGLDWSAGQGEDNVKEFEATLAGEAPLRSFLNDERDMMLTADAAGLVQGMSTILPEVDKKAIMKNEEAGEHMVATFKEALRVSIDGWFDDDMACVQPWGFELDEVKVPVLLYQGSEDKMVPFAHGKWLAEHLPKEKLRVHLLEGQGHISIVQDYAEKMLDELLEIAKA